jgi:hypothetical protein
MKSFTKGGSTVSGTRFARWRWVAPAGTGISRVTGTWWHTLHDGMEQRIGPALERGFDRLRAGGTDTTPRDFVAGFSAAAGARGPLLCARAESKWCASNRLVVGGAGADDHDPGRHRPPPGSAAELAPAAGAAAAGRRFWGRRRRRCPLRRDAIDGAGSA